MNDLAKGGRGKKAPYSSTHYRLPIPLKPIAEEMAANYRELVTEYEDPEDPALIAAVIQAIAPAPPLPPRPETLITRINLDKAIAVLQYATTLKANSGGAIKERIREALLHLS